MHINLLIRKQMLLVLFCAILTGALIGVFILFPVNEFVYFQEHNPDTPTARKFVLTQLYEALKGNAPEKTFFYAAVGGLLGLATAMIYIRFHRRLTRLRQLADALGKDIEMLIARGEGPRLEFKSSFRWDFKQSSVNRELEFVVLKTLAGFLNGEGGTLLIGVDDEQQVVGIENDLKTLKRQDADGFEQTLMTAISNNLGTEMCQYTQCVFHSMDNNNIVCRVIVTSSPRPVYIKKSGAIKFYLRAGGGTRELNVQEVMEYAANRWE